MPAADTRRAQRDAERKKTGGRGAVIGAVALLVLGAGGLYAATSGEQSEVPSSCESTVRVAVVTEPGMAQALAAKPIDPESCILLQVTEQDSAETARLAAADQVEEPLWIPDSSGRVDASGFDGSVVAHTDSLASSPPIVLSRDDDEPLPATWTEVLREGDARMGDPSVDGGALAALRSVMAESEAGVVEPSEAASALTTRAQTQGVDSPVLSADGLIAAVRDSGGSSIVAERDYLADVAAGGAVLTARTPSSGAALLDYPLLMVGGPQADNDALQEAADEIEQWFDDDAGRAALADARLRPADGSAPADGAPAQIASLMTVEDGRAWDAAAETYRRQSAPLNGLVVVDASGSMAQAEPGGGTRWQTAMSTLQLGSQLFPARDAIGLWLFSQDLGPDGQPYRVLVPVRGLDEQLGDGRTQREALQEAVQDADYKRGGETELYETTLAAFGAQQQNWRPGQLNAVILMSDGGQETYGEGGSSRIEDLVSRLEQEQDPSRPVYIVALGISEDADDAALGAIAGATGGSYHQTTNEQELQEAFIEALSTLGG